MAKYRRNLPQFGGSLFLTDGGLETSLIFHEGIELPHFASFVLLDSDEGQAALRRYYEKYLAISRAGKHGFVLDTPTWRANPDWGKLLGYGLAELKAANARSIDFVSALRGKWETPSSQIVLNGVVGPRGDGYKAGRMERDEAEDYHSFQVATFAGTEADMVSAITMNTVNEAIGVARAAKAHGIPCVISFTVETDGRLVDGSSLRRAIEETDEATDASPAYYMVNCAHPTHFEDALKANEPWMKRVCGIRANASAKSHAELDESEALDDGDPVDLGSRYRALTRSFSHMRVLGGCCGTDHRHIAAICEACTSEAYA